MYGIIYKAVGPGGKVYIGQTTYPLERRKGQHKYRSLKKDKRSAFQIALLDEGFSNFIWEEIDTAETAEDLDAKEKGWIARYDSMNPEKGYNNQDGGIHCLPSLETRRKLSESHKGKPLSGERLRKLIESNTGEKNHWFGKLLPEHTRKRCIEAHKGKHPWNFGLKMSEEHIKSAVEARKKSPKFQEHLRKLHESQKGKRIKKEEGQDVI
jgi:group I intron endonuclease